MAFERYAGRWRERSLAAGWSGDGTSNMTQLKSNLRLGIALHQQGRLNDAERAYQNVLREQPTISTRCICWG